MKASYVVANLSATAVTKISPWILTQKDHSNISYKDLRVELLRLYDLPASTRARKLLSFPSMGMGGRDLARLCEEMFHLSHKADVSQVDLLLELYVSRRYPRMFMIKRVAPVVFLSSQAQTIWLQTSATYCCSNSKRGRPNSRRHLCD